MSLSHIHDFFGPSWPERNLVIYRNEDKNALESILNIDLVEMEDKYEVHADLPGVDEADLDVSIENHHLVIKGHRERNYDVENSTSHRIERSYGAVSRSIRLPRNADQGCIDASFNNGVLTVTLPKVAPTPSATKIPINIKK